MVYREIVCSSVELFVNPLNDHGRLKCALWGFSSSQPSALGFALRTTTPPNGRTAALKSGLTISRIAGLGIAKLLPLLQAGRFAAFSRGVTPFPILRIVFSAAAAPSTATGLAGQSAISALRARRPSRGAAPSTAMRRSAVSITALRASSTFPRSAVRSRSARR
jgi:hypothetical protein